MLFGASTKLLLFGFEEEFGTIMFFDLVFEKSLSLYVMKLSLILLLYLRFVSGSGAGAFLIL